MENNESQVIEHFFGKTIKPGETSTIALMFRELVISNVALRSIGEEDTLVKGIIEGQEFIIATLNKKHPQQRVDFKFTKDCLFVSFEVTGKSEVDLIGYVIGLDTSNILPLKEAMELSDRSDDEDYKEEGSDEEEEKEEKEEKESEEEEEEKEDDDEDEDDEIDSENDEEYEKMMVNEEEKMMEEEKESEEDEEEEKDEEDDEEEDDEIDSENDKEYERMMVNEEEKMMENEDEEEEEEEEENDEKPRDAIDENAPGFKHMGRLIKYKDLEIGTGNFPMKGHRIAIHYKITTPTGDCIDSENPDDFSRLPFPTSFRLGLGNVVNGLNRGIQTMRVGGTRVILISPEMGFGDRGNITADIRPGESFLVEVHLLESH